jgi:hypothetical protein
VAVDRVELDEISHRPCPQTLGLGQHPDRLETPPSDIAQRSLSDVLDSPSFRQHHANNTTEGV